MCILCRRRLSYLSMQYLLLCFFFSSTAFLNYSLVSDVLSCKLMMILYFLFVCLFFLFIFLQFCVDFVCLYSMRYCTSNCMSISFKRAPSATEDSIHLPAATLVLSISLLPFPLHSVFFSAFRAQSGYFLALHLSCSFQRPLLSVFFCSVLSCPLLAVPASTEPESEKHKNN